MARTYLVSILVSSVAYWFNLVVLLGLVGAMSWLTGLASTQRLVSLRLILPPIMLAAKQVVNS